MLAQAVLCVNKVYCLNAIPILGFPSTSLGVLNGKEQKKNSKKERLWQDCGTDVYKPSSLYCSLHLNYMVIDFVKYTA